jgi:hypothetical protein
MRWRGGKFEVCGGCAGVDWWIGLEVEVQLIRVGKVGRSLEVSRRFTNRLKPSSPHRSRKTFTNSWSAS